MFYYRPQTKFANVMFLHLSVILFKVGHVWRGRGGVAVRGRGGHAWQGGQRAWWRDVRGGDVHGGGYVWQGGMCGRGMHGRWVCMVGGMHATDTPRTQRYTVGQCTSGMQPTGMQSC